MRPCETMDVLSSHPQILSCVQEIRNGKPRLIPFHDISASIQVMALVLVGQGIAFGAAIISLIWNNLPVCLFPMAESVGIIPSPDVPRFAWQLAFLPLEYLAYLPPMFMATFTASIIVAEVAVLQLYLKELRYG